jgi:FixJ family two-component response regulator
MPSRAFERKLNSLRHEKKPHPTPREWEVLKWIAAGKTASEIARILKIIKRTVDQHSEFFIGNYLHAMSVYWIAGSPFNVRFSPKAANESAHVRF